MDKQNEVLEFIKQFLGGQYASLHDRNLLRHKFIEGYCYYFAKMLENAFGRGIVCWAAPAYHFVWQDLKDGQCYDIDGIFDIKAHNIYYLIPEDFVGSMLPEYKHVKSEPGITKEQMVQIIKEYCAKTNQEYRSSIEEYLS